MAFKQIEGNGDGNRISEYFPKKASERKEGDNVVGVYKGTRLVRRPSSNEQETLYVLEGEGGKLIGVNESPVIKTKMAQVAEGMTIKIQFEGKKTGKTGRQYNDFSVWIDEDAKPEDEEDLGF